MEFLSLAKARKTVFEFSDKKVPDSAIHKILEAGQWAPSCANSQPWSFIVVKDPRQIEALVETANYGSFHTTPTLIIAVVMRQDYCIGVNHACFQGGYSGTNDTIMSVGMSALQMALEATSLGIDSCFLTPVPSKIKKILKTKKEDIVPIFIGLGYERKGAFQRKRVRRPLEEMVSEGVFKTKYFKHPLKHNVISDENKFKKIITTILKK